MIQVPELGGIAPGFDPVKALETALEQTSARAVALCRCELLHVERDGGAKQPGVEHPAATFLARVVLRDRRNGDFETALYAGRIATRGGGADLALQPFPSREQSPQLAALLGDAPIRGALPPAVRRYLGDEALRVELVTHQPRDRSTLRVTGKAEATATVFESGDASALAEQFETLRRAAASQSSVMLWPGVLGFDAATSTLWTTHPQGSRPLLGYPARRSVAHAPWERVGRALAALHREELPRLRTLTLASCTEELRTRVAELGAAERSMRPELLAVLVHAERALTARAAGLPVTLHGALDATRLVQVADRIGFDERAHFAAGPREFDLASLLVSLEVAGVFPAVARRALDATLAGYMAAGAAAPDPVLLDACFRLQLLRHAHDLWRAGGALARGRVRALLRRAQRGLTHVLADARSAEVRHAGAEPQTRPLPRLFREPAAV